MSTYRRLLAVLLAWSVLPLPFTGIVLPPFWLIALGAAAALWWSARPLRLSVAWENLLGMLFVIVVLAVGGLHVGPLRPLGHLLLLLAVLRTLGVGDRRTFVRTLPMVGLLWVVGVASSTHVSLLAYLALSVALGWWAGMRVLLLGAAEDLGEDVTTLPRPRHVVTATVVVVALAVPLFVAIPRLRSPWVAAGARGSRSVSGFSEAVQLGAVGRIQTSQEVALVVGVPDGVEAAQVVSHLRGAVFDLLRTGQWVPRRANPTPLLRRNGVVRLVDEVHNLSRLPVLHVEQLQPERYLFLPAGTVAVRSTVPLMLDGAGGVAMQRWRRRPVSYDAWIDPGAARQLGKPSPRDTALPHPSPELDRLAAAAVGDARGTAARAEAVIRFLRQRCRYALDAAPPAGRDPVLWFLDEGRRGHCEYFAGAMVMLLRSLDVPARMVGGYAGGSVSPNGREVYVRQANAHTWVEVWGGPDRGWMVFDPTPAEGIPGLSGLDAAARLRWLWDTVQITWDRWILTFGSVEQGDLWASATSGALAVLREVTAVRVVMVGFLALLLVAVGRWLRRAVGRRRPPRRLPAARAVDRLADRLVARGEVLSPGATVRVIGATAAHRWPQARTAVARLVGLAERELYSGRALGGGHEADARRLWADVRREVRGGGGRHARR